MRGSGLMVCGNGVQIPNCMARLDAAAGRHSACLPTSLLAYARTVPDAHRSRLEICNVSFAATAAIPMCPTWPGRAVRCDRRPRPRPRRKITAGMVAHGPPQWPQYIADELGWNKEAGIELDYITVGGGGAQQLAGGSLNVAHSGYPDFARTLCKGRPRGSSSTTSSPRRTAFSPNPTIKQIADLKGKLISIGGAERYHVDLHQAVSGIGRPDNDGRRFCLCQGCGRPLCRVGRRRCRRNDPQPADLPQSVCPRG